MNLSLVLYEPDWHIVASINKPVSKVYDGRLAAAPPRALAA